MKTNRVLLLLATASIAVAALAQQPRTPPVMLAAIPRVSAIPLSTESRSIATVPAPGIALGMWNVNRYRVGHPYLYLTGTETLYVRETAWVKAVLYERDDNSDRPRFPVTVICSTTNPKESCYHEERFYEKFQ